MLKKRYLDKNKKKAKVKSKETVLIIYFWVVSVALAYYSPYSLPSTTSLGDAVTANSGDLSSILHNPAVISRINHYGIELMLSDLYGLDFDVISIAYNNPLAKGNLGIFIGLISSSDMPVTDVYRYSRSGGQTDNGIVLDASDKPSILGYYKENRSLIFITYSLSILRYLDIGISIKRHSHSFGGDLISDRYINAMIHSKANGLGFDFGVIYNFKNIDIGIALVDILNTNLDWNTEYEYTEKLPERFIFGIKGKFLDIKLLTEIEKRSDFDKIIIGCGAEYNLLKYFNLRCGYNSESLLSTGIGIDYDISKVISFLGIAGDKKNYISINYSISLLSAIGLTHKISLIYKIGN